jgi:hypothetical protein
MGDNRLKYWPKITGKKKKDGEGADYGEEE